MNVIDGRIIHDKQDGKQTKEKRGDNGRQI